MKKVLSIIISLTLLSTIISGCKKPAVTKTPSELSSSETSSMITSVVSEAISTESSKTAVSDPVATNSTTNAPTKIPTKIPTKVPTKTPTKIAIKIGDYVQMGKYYDEPILWRCVDIDENGSLMLADKILTIKPFDAKGSHKYLDGTLQTDNSENYRTNYGSNLWETSNMRSWLNSTAKAGNVKWLDGCPPTLSAVRVNDYSDEKGFLAEGNFTDSENSAIKSVTQKSILDGIDANKLKLGGTAIYDSSWNISTIVQNYDTAYYHYVTDKMFLLDVKQINKIWQNSNLLGDNYYIGKPTQKAVDNTEYHGIGGNIDPSNYCDNWLRTPYPASSFPCFVRFVDLYGDVNNDTVSNYILGVRPAFYINLSSVIFKSGNGSETNPFIVK